MTDSSMPLLRQAAAWARRTLCAVPMRFAMIVAIVVAVASSAHAAAPFAVRVSGAGAGGPPLHHAGRPAWFEQTLASFVP